MSDENTWNTCHGCDSVYSGEVCLKCQVEQSARHAAPEPEPAVKRLDEREINRRTMFFDGGIFMVASRQSCRPDFDYDSAVGTTRFASNGGLTLGVFYAPDLALPAATGTPTERRATLERAFDSIAERLSYNYSAMLVDPEMSAIRAELNDAISEQWYERGWPNHAAAA